MRSLGWALIQHDWCPYKKGKQTHRDNAMWLQRQRLQCCSCKPRNAWNHQKLAEAGSILPQGFRGSTALPMLWFQTASLQNSERIHFCHFVCVCVCVCVFFHFGCTGSSLHAGLYPVAYGSSLTRVWTCVLCIGRETLNHWTTREVPNFCSFRPPSLWYFVMAALGNEDTFIPPTQKP